MFFVWKEIKRCTNRCTVYLFSFVPENIQPKMIPNIRYFAPTWCALFSYFISCGTLPIASKYGDECNKRRHIHRSILGTFFSHILSLLLFFNLHLKWQVIACDVFLLYVQNFGQFSQIFNDFPAYFNHITFCYKLFRMSIGRCINLLQKQ